MAQIPVMFLAVVACASLIMCGAVDDDGWDWRQDDIRSDQSSSSDCTHSGYKCSSDCSLLINCRNTGTHFKTVITNCSEHSRTCDPYTKQCSSSVTACPTFKCTQSGTYPDLIDCGTYHICDSDNTETTVPCEDGYVYNATVQDCVASSSSTTSCKTTPVPKCVNATQTGALDSDPTIYYICVSGEPQLYQCENHLQYNALASECADPSVSCATGKRNYADPSNCYKYYVCTSKGTFPTHETCEEGDFFDDVIRKCRSGTCGTS